MSGYDDSLVIVDDVDERSLFKKIKSAGTIAAVVMGAIAAAAIFAPAFTAVTTAYLFTGGFTAYGIYKIVSYVKMPKPLRSGYMLADGLLSSFLGGMILFDAFSGPEGKAGMIATLAFAAGFMALFNGVSETADYFSLRKAGFPGAGFILFSGILRMLLGGLIIMDPFFGYFSIQMILGIFMMITAISLFIETRSITVPELRELEDGAER